MKRYGRTIAYLALTIIWAAAPLSASAQCGGHMGSGHMMGNSGQMGQGSGHMDYQTSPDSENNANYIKPYKKYVPSQPARTGGQAQSGQMNENPSHSDHDHTNH